MSGIIKAGGTIDSRRGAQREAFNLEDVSQKAGSYLDTARSQANRIISRAETEAEQLRQRGRTEGREEAVEEAKAAARSELEMRLETLLPALDESIRSIEQAKQAWLSRWETGAVRLAVAIAEKIIRREVRQSPEISLDLIREALELAAGSAQVNLRLHPQDAETLGEQAQKLLAEISNVGSAEVIADPQVGLGGCRVQTEFGEIDQRLESQLARIEEELTM